MSSHSHGAGFSRRQLLLASAAVTGAHLTTSAHASGLLTPGRPFPPTLADRLATIARTVKAKRTELGIPGVTLAIVQDEAVLMLKSFGVRDTKTNNPVTADTLFAIGSDTKAFTAAAAIMSAEAGVLSLDDSPKEYLPYFRLLDPEADARITLRDLLRHNSGIMRTDLNWVSGVLTREEAIRTLSNAKPTAKFGEKFQYQNLMYVAAGEAMGAAHGTTWEDVIEQGIFVALGMNASTTSIMAMRKSFDFATGYQRVNDTLVPTPEIDRSNISAAGAICANGRDIVQWLRFLNARGAIDGNRLMSLAGFKEMTRRHIAATPAGYGLGFFVGRRGRHKTVYHGGNIDGFESHLFLVPELRLGMMLMTNVAQSALPSTVVEAIWANLVEDGAAAAPSGAKVDPKAELGRYAGPGASTEIVMRGAQLTAVFHGQPEYALTPVGARRYAFAKPAPEVFFITFRSSKEADGPNEILLEQPHGNLVLKRLKPANAAGGLDAAEQELIGHYDLQGARIDIEQRGDFAVVLIPGQHPYTLVAKERDLFALAELTDDYRLAVTRDGANAVSGIVFRQPQGSFPAQRIAASALAPDMTLDALMEKVIAAIGGEEKLRARGGMRASADITMENLGLTARGETSALRIDTRHTVITVFGLGKTLGTINHSCEGGISRTQTSFSAGTTTGSCTSDVDYASLLDWKTRWLDVSLERKTTFGNEEAYVVAKRGKDIKEVDTISATSFRVLQRETHAEIGGAMVRVSTEAFEDYRVVDGILVPMRSTTEHVLLGRMNARVTEVSFAGGDGTA